MVLEEAKILNKPIVITDTAARETINNYNKGQVLENSEEAIYEGLKIILENGKNIKQENLTNVVTYDNTHIIKKIIELFEN